MQHFWRRRLAANQATAAPPPALGFRFVRYFTVASLAAFLLVAAALLYFERRENEVVKQVQQKQNAFFAQMQDSFAQRHDAAAHADLLRVHEAGNVNLTRLFANALWEKDFAPFVAKAQRIPVDQCRAIADVKDADGKTVQPGEKQACYAGIGKQIMAFPEFRALDAKVFDTMKKSIVFKIKVYDLRGITVYSSEHNQIGEDKTGNTGWNSAVAGKPASQLTHRDKFSAFEGAVENRDLIEIYLPVLAPGSDKIVAVFEVYSDVTQFLEQIKNTSSQIQKLNAENQAQVQRAAAANQDKVGASADLLLAIVLGLLALLYIALFLIVRNGQRIIDQQDFERKQAEEEIRKTQSFLNSIVDNIPSMVFVKDARELRIVHFNRAGEQLTGYSQEQRIGKNVYDFFPKDQADFFTANDRETLRRGGHVFIEEEPITTRGGTTKILQTKKLPIPDEHGRPKYLLGISEDVTERKPVQRELEDETERLRIAQGMALMVSMDWDIEPDRISWSRPPEWLLGPRPQTGSYPLFKNMVHPEDRQHFMAKRQAALEGSEEHQLDYRIVRTDGELRWVTSRGRVFRDVGGRAVRMHVALQDITERKQTEQALHDYAGRLQGVSRRLFAVEETERRNINRELHDRIGQKLAALNINLNLIRSQLPQESLRVVSARLQDTQTLLEETAAQIRDIMADLHPPALDDYGLLAALRTYAESFGARVAVPITVHGEDLAPRLSLAVEMALFRVAQGALANTVTHARAKRIQVMFAATTDRATLTIADDGAGFDVARAALAHASWGLSIMRERAEAVGARLTVESTPGKGTRVVVEIKRGAA